MNLKLSDLGFGKPGPHTREQRQKASARAKNQWADRNKAIAALNKNRHGNAVRRLRFLTKGADGEIFSQANFAFYVLGLSPNNAQRVSQLENGMCVPLHLIERMMEYAREHGINWDYADGEKEQALSQALSEQAIEPKTLFQLSGEKQHKVPEVEAMQIVELHSDESEQEKSEQEAVPASREESETCSIDVSAVSNDLKIILQKVGVIAKRV